MWHFIEQDLAVDLPHWLAHFGMVELALILERHARFVEEYGD